MFPLGAIIKNTNEYVYVYPNIANKNNKFECPKCHEDVILRQGNIQIHHFAYYKKGDCENYNNPTDTQIHKNGKQLMKK